MSVCVEADVTSWAQVLKVMSTAMRLKTSAVMVFTLYLKTRCLKHNHTERSQRKWCPLHALPPSEARISGGSSITIWSFRSYETKD